MLQLSIAILFGAAQLGSPVDPKIPRQCRGKTPHILPANLVKSWLSPLPPLFPTQPIVPGKVVQHVPPKWQVWFLSAQHNWFAFPFHHSSLKPPFVQRFSYELWGPRSQVGAWCVHWDVRIAWPNLGYGKPYPHLTLTISPHDSLPWNCDFGKIDQP